MINILCRQLCVLVPNLRQVWSITSGRKQSKIFLHLFSKNEKQMNNYASSNFIHDNFKYFRSEFYFPTENSLLHNKWCSKFKNFDEGKNCECGSLHIWLLKGELTQPKNKTPFNLFFFFQTKKKVKTYQQVDLDRDKIEVKRNLVLI